MTYKDKLTATFLSRPNRFIAHIDVAGRTEIAHVKNTGRCKELLIPGAKVILHKSDDPKRKTAYDLVAVYKEGRLVNIDSQAPNKVFTEYMKSGKYITGITHIKPEAKYGSSRFDFYVEAGHRKIFIEVKGVTLEVNGAAMFPDAPTERGVRHLNELSQCIAEGYEAHAVFVIQLNGVDYFTPNNETHPAFGTALTDAKKAGVKVSAFDCVVTVNGLTIGDPVLIKL